MNQRIFKLSIGVLTTVVFLSCTREKETKLVIQLPPAGILSGSKVNSSSDDGSSWSGEITTSSQINCYFVGVGGSGAGMKRNSCREKDTNTTLFTFGEYVGGVPAGSSIEISVPSNGTGEITLAAMNAASGYCKSFKDDGPGDGQISHPRVIGTQTVTLKPGPMDISFTVPSSLTSLKQIDECDVDDGGGGIGGGNSMNPFGDGRDGSLTTISSNHDVDFNNDTLSASGATHSPSPGGVAGTKMASSSDRVYNIDTATAKVLTLANSFTLNDFEPGDLVLWHVSSASLFAGSPDDACGGELYRGRWDFAKIVAVDLLTQKITLENAISSSPGTLANARIGAAAANYNGTNHCYIQVTRVPQFETLTVNSGHTLNFANIGYVPASNKGGITAVQVKNLVVNGTLNINSSGNGFPGASSGSYGVAGGGGNDSTNESGGGHDLGTLSGGGGGQAGRGADTGTNDNMSGSPVLFCIGASVCFPFKDRKMFFGGGGGGNGTNAGANGGGIILLMARDVTGTGTITLTANGGSSGYIEAGGGAGGSVAFFNRSLGAGVTVNTSALGGNAMGDGGAGGGGTVEVSNCSTLNLGTINANPSVVVPGTDVGTPIINATDGAISTNELSSIFPQGCL